MGLVTFWANFSQTHLVTLKPTPKDATDLKFLKPSINLAYYVGNWPNDTFHNLSLILSGQ
jgi:hypothetical protein